MALDISAVRQALADAAEVTGITTVTYVADTVEPPTFEVGEVSIDFDESGPIDILTVTCRLYVSRATDVLAQPELDQFMQRAGSKSLKAALEADTKLAGTCQAMRCTRIDGYRVYQVAGIPYLGAQLTVIVMG